MYLHAECHKRLSFDIIINIKSRNLILYITCMCNQNTSFNEYDIEQKLINSIIYEKNVSHAAYTCMYPGLQLLMTMLHNGRQTGRVYLEYSKQLNTVKKI